MVTAGTRTEVPADQVSGWLGEIAELWKEDALVVYLGPESFWKEN